MVSALIFAGGVGVRMKSKDIPKQFLEIDGKPIIIHTLEHFSKHDMVNNIVVVCIESWIDDLRNMLLKYGISKVVSVIPGGETGFQSIHLGLLEIAKNNKKDDDIVLICDGVRPILTEDLITDCINETRKYTSAVPVTPSIDSVLYSDDGQSCSKNISRKKIFITQAPQGYTMKRITDAHDRAIKMGMEAISSADLLIELGEEVHLIKGLRDNIKVTTPEDLNTLRSIAYYEHFQNFAREGNYESI